MEPHGGAAAPQGEAAEGRGRRRAGKAAAVAPRWPQRAIWAAVPAAAGQGRSKAAAAAGHSSARAHLKGRAERPMAHSSAGAPLSSTST